MRLLEAEKADHDPFHFQGIERGAAKKVGPDITALGQNCDVGFRQDDEAGPSI